MSKLRRDPLTGDLVLMAAERSARPDEYVPERPRVAREGPCPFCPDSEEATPEPRIGYPDDLHWLSRVVPNRFPAIDPQRGRHLVVIESPRHVRCWTELTRDERLQALLACQDQLGRCFEDGLPYAQVFKNAGPGAGASIEHCHSQLLASGAIPERVSRELRGATAYQQQHGACYFCQLSRGPTVLATSSFAAVCPSISRFPYEVWVLPRRHESRFEQASGLGELGELLQQLVAGLRQLFPHASYNWLLHTAPHGWEETPSEDYHWHLELMPRLAKLAGYELATGHYINVVDPSQAAERLRAACSGSVAAQMGAIGANVPDAKSGTDYSD